MRRTTSRPACRRCPRSQVLVSREEKTKEEEEAKEEEEVQVGLVSTKFKSRVVVLVRKLSFPDTRAEQKHPTFGKTDGLDDRDDGEVARGPDEAAQHGEREELGRAVVVRVRGNDIYYEAHGPDAGAEHPLEEHAIPGVKRLHREEVAAEEEHGYEGA